MPFKNSISGGADTVKNILMQILVFRIRIRFGEYNISSWKYLTALPAFFQISPGIVFRKICLPTKVTMYCIIFNINFTLLIGYFPCTVSVYNICSKCLSSDHLIMKTIRLHRAGLVPWVFSTDIQVRKLSTVICLLPDFYHLRKSLCNLSCICLLIPEK
jgi:hypothetical protein